MGIYLGEKIKVERKKKGLLQKDLCCEGITKSTISKIENNTLIPSLTQLEQICKILKIEMYELFLDDSNLHSINLVSSSTTSVPSQEIILKDSITNLKNYFEDKAYFSIIELFNSPTQCTHFLEAYCVGMSYFEIKEFLYAQKYLKRAITLFKILDYSDKKHHAEKLANSFNTLGKISYTMNDYGKSLHYFYKAKIILESFNLFYIELYATVINNIGGINGLISEYHKAIKVLEDYLDMKISQQYFSKLASIHLNLSISYFKTYNFEKSILHIGKAIFFFNYMEQRSDEAECHLNYINYLRYSGNFKEAFSVLKNAIQTYDDENQKNRFYLQQLILFYNIKDFSSIQKLHTLFNIKIARERSIKEYYFIMGHVEFINNNFKKSHYYYNKCINYLLKNHLYLDLSIAYNDLGIMLNSDEFLRKSIDFKKLYFSLKNKPLRTNITLESSSEINF